jgi:DMSO/TMAO reductase YedYZ heme-binding membrane subunit
VDGKLWWYVARSSGFIAWGLAAASVIWGLLLSTRFLGRKPGGPWINDLHGFLGLSSLVAVGVHLVALHADTYTHWGLADLLVPMATDWKPGATAWGVVAMWAMIVVQVSSWLRNRMSKQLWRRLHLLAFITYATSTMHLLQAGTDADNTYVRLAVEVSIAVIVGLLVYRPFAVRSRSRRSRIAQAAA